MASLEEAIREARLKASSSGILSERENDELLILQKSRHASRKCVLMGKENPGNMAVLSQGPNQLSSKEMASIDDSNDEVQFWKSKYEGMMSVLIETEKDMEEQAKLHQQRQATLENYCNLLQQKADNLEAQTGGSSAIQLEDKVESMRRLLAFFEMATGMVVKEGNGTDAPSDEWRCIVKNKALRRATAFSVSITDTDELDFTPTGNPELLPEYCRNGITFEQDMLPVLVGDILGELYADGENEPGAQQ
jgi:hypothetical protein